MFSNHSKKCSQTGKKKKAANRFSLKIKKVESHYAGKDKKKYK